MKQKVANFINEDLRFVKFIYALIVLNVIVLVLESFKSLRETYSVFFDFVELVSVIIFSIEYVLRIWVAKHKIKFVFSVYGIIDLLAIMPFYLPYLFKIDLRVLRLLRILRIVRVFKLGRYSKSFKLMHNVFKETKTELLTTFL